VRYGVLLGTAVAVALLGAVSAVVLHRGDPTKHGPNSSAVAMGAPSGPAANAGEPAVPADAPQPKRPVPPSFDIVKVGPTGTAVIAGRAEPESKVVVRDGEKVIGTATADRRGEWVLVPDQPIPPGDRLLSLEASPRQGGEAVRSDETVALSIAPGKQSQTALAVVLPRDGGAAARVLQRPEPGRQAVADGAAPGKPNTLSMDAVEYDPQGRMVLSGRATPGATVQIYIGNEPAASATADAFGLWSATSTKVPGRARAELRLDQLGEGGQVVQRLALPFGQVKTVQLAPGQSYVVQPGNSLWRIARQTYGNGTRYLIIYSANLSQIRDPDRIYPGQVFKVPKS
jgi:nucleoid-associated protein YgaU